MKKNLSIIGSRRVPILETVLLLRAKKPSKASVNIPKVKAIILTVIFFFKKRRAKGPLAIVKILDIVNTKIVFHH